MGDFIPNPLSIVRFNLPARLSGAPGCQASTSPVKSSKASGSSAVNTLSRAAKGASERVRSLWDGLDAEGRNRRWQAQQHKEELYRRMKYTVTFKDWELAAQELDVIEGNIDWRQDAYTGDYDARLIRDRMQELDGARASGDVRAMMHLVRTALSRDLGGMGNADLYRHSYVGTKTLIEQYVESAVLTIESLVEESAKRLPDSLTNNDMLDCILLARQSFGRSALLLSGGATFGMLHIGVVKTLFEAKLLPRLISGTSAGSIVCAVLCTRTDSEIPEVIRDFPYGDLDVFEKRDKPEGLLGHLSRLLTEGSWSDLENLTRVVRDLLGDITFQEAYNRTRRILNITVSTESVYELPRLLNYITAPNVMIWSAVAASCSVPIVFSPAALLVKNPLTGEHLPWDPTPQKWIDGSVDNDLPMTRLAEMFNVNHFIVSQVNAHVVPFLAKDGHLEPPTKRGGRERERERQEMETAGQGPDWMYTVKNIAKEEALHRLQFLIEMGICPNWSTKLWGMLSQSYSGDINILPEIYIRDLPKILVNPSVDFMLRACQSGEKATWPKMCRIRDRCAIELALDRAVHSLRARVVFSKSQVNLRRLAAGAIYQPRVKTASTAAAHEGGTDDDGDGAGGSRPRAGSKVGIDGPSRVPRRRGSGGSMQLLPHHRRMLLENTVTDEETEEEERLEMLGRSGQLFHQGQHSHSQPQPRKPRLRRAARSQFDVSNLGPLTSPVHASGDEHSEFDFSRPILPTRHSASRVDQVGRNFGFDYMDAEGSATHDNDEQSGVPTSRETITSPTDDLETTDPRSSDADVDSKTEESRSDEDPYSQVWSRVHRSESDQDHDHDGEGESEGEAGDEQIEDTSADAGESSEPESGPDGDNSDIPDPSGGGLWD